MEKVRVYELAKELNTTSKRLMEKLGEIDIEVKNHMSLLKEEQIKALYDHIGVIRHDHSPKAEVEEKKVSAPVSPPEVQQEKRKAMKQAPRIIRKTEIIIDTKSEDEDRKDGFKPQPKGNNSRGNNKNDRKRGFVKQEGTNSGLRAGFVRDTGIDQLLNINENKASSANNKKEDEKEKQKATEFKTENNVQNQPNKNKETEQAKKEDGMKSKVYEKPDKVKTADLDANKMPAKQEPRKNERRVESQDGLKNGSVKRREEKPTNRPDKPYKNNFKQDGRRQPGDKSEGNTNQNRRGPRFGDKKTQPANRTDSKTLKIPKPELTTAQKEEMNSQRNEVRRENQNKDSVKDVKRDQKKDTTKHLSTPPKNRRSKSPKIFVGGEKKEVSEVLSEDFILKEFYDDDGIKRKKPARGRRDSQNTQQPTKHIPPRAVLTSITIPESLTVKELAEALKKTSAEIIKKLMGLGVMATLNHEVDFDTASLVADEFGVKAEQQVVVSEEDILFDEEVDDEKELESRPPVVVVMGHVDHGKTSLLDAIREENVIDSEAGGITQHIGAYMVKINNRNITFLDTPGHEAFTAMRARGAQVTDIAILVVAADDGVMPQTIEAINHAKAANVSIIVAINKMDKPGANPDRVKQELTEHGLVPEEWGGDVICVPVSAKQRENIEHLLEMVLLAADMLELKASPNKQAKGTIVEAKLDKDRGPIATMLVQRGTLCLGDSIVTGSIVGRIRAMVDDKGHRIKTAGPSTPVEILGLPEVPEAGEIFYAITDEKVAKQLVEKRRLKQREQQLKSSAKVSLDDLFTQIQEGKVKDLNVIVKADVQGSVEAVKQSLEKLSNDEVRVRAIHGAVGAVNEADVTLAAVSNAVIIGFNVRPPANVIDAAKDAGVDIRLYRVIYNAIEDIQAAMKGLLDPTFKEVIQGHAEIRQTFKVSGIGTIGGSYVTDGKIVRNSEVRVVRDGIVIHEGKLASLKRFKDDAKEVAQGYECGLSIEKFNDIKEGDIVECFVMEEVEK